MPFGINRPVPAPLPTLLLAVVMALPVQSAVIEETGSLREFFAGTEQGCAYDNWISHTSEYDATGTPGNFAPPELDRETNGFGAYQVVDNLQNPDQVLTDWYAIFSALVQNNPSAAETQLANSWMADKYQIVRLTDNGKVYLIAREILNNNYFDNNGTPDDATDDVTGSFDLGWGLFVFCPSAANPEVVIEVVHPSTDFIAPYIAIDAFLTLDAGCLFVNGASRNIAWSGGGSYSSDLSLSDPSRNARTPFHEAHKAAVNFIQNEWALQLHGFNPDPAHAGIPTAQVSLGRESLNYQNPNPPLMGWNHFDLISLTPNPPVAFDAQEWPYPEPSIAGYYTVYYPGRYNWRGKIPIPNNVDLPGDDNNCQMVYSHLNFNFINADENWTHIEMDEWPDVIRLAGVSQLDFLRAFEDGLTGVPTYQNYKYMVNYYRPIFTAAAAYLQGSPSTIAQVISETAPLADFYQGATQNCAYDNWVSHISEGIAVAGYNDYGPAELDRQTTGFGYFQLVPNGAPGDALLNGWRNVFNAFNAGDAAATATALTNAGLGGIYQVALLSDPVENEEYLILREQLDNYFFDNNGTPANAADDVTGSFNYGWGLYIKNLNASRPEVILEVPHPCDDYIAPAIAMDAFKTLDAGLLFVAGAGREVVWTDVAPYSNSKSLSDPSRNARHPFHIAHQAAVDAIEGELAIQVHSYDVTPTRESDPTYKSVELSAYNDLTPNPPLMDRISFIDLISLMPEYPIPANSVGSVNHSAERINNYCSVHYPGGSYAWQNQVPLQISCHQPGYSDNQQMLYSHINHNALTDPENWLHFEQYEFPKVINENILSFYGSDGSVPDYANYANIVEYYHPLYASIARFLNAAPVWTSVPNSVEAQAGDLIQFTVTGADADGDPLTITYTSGNLPQGVQFTDNGDGSGVFVWQTAENSGGDYTASFRLADEYEYVDAVVPITVLGGVSTAYATAEQTVAGARQGSYTNLTTSDNTYETITEILSGGKPNARYSYLEHIWTFPIVGNQLELHIEAFHTANGEGDDFIIAGSFDGANYTDLLTVSKTADDNNEQVAAIEGTSSGDYYVRVRDANRAAGRTILDAFRADRLYINYQRIETIMFVDDIAMSLVSNKNNVSARSVITVVSTAGAPVAGATVSAAWSGLTNANVQGTTNGSGQVTFTSAALRNPTGDFILTVTNVALANWTYDPGRNNETSDYLRVVNGRLAGLGDEPAQTALAPEASFLNPAYPNPFNSRVWIPFGLSEAGPVKIGVFDLYGRSVASLLNGERAAGYWTVEWNSANAPAGVYLIKIEAETFNAVQKVMLVR